jgi:hypothetical protein
MAKRYQWFDCKVSHDNCDVCSDLAKGAIVDTHDFCDPDYPEGFHMQHLCELHGMLMLDMLNKEETWEK